MELEEMLRAHWLIPFSQRDQSCLIQLCLWFNKLKLQHSRCHSSPGQSKCFSRCFPWCLHQHFQGRTALPVHTESSWETSSCKILHSYFCLLPSSVTLLAFPAPLFSSLHSGLEYRSEKSPRGIVQHSQMCLPLFNTPTRSVLPQKLRKMACWRGEPWTGLKQKNGILLFELTLFLPLM